MTKKSNMKKKKGIENPGDTNDNKLLIVLGSTLILAILIIVAFIWTSF